MRLYFKPGACSLASRIVLTELGVPFDEIKVDTGTGLTETGTDYRAINSKGYVPALEIEPGVVITENPAILQHLADSRPAAALAPASGTLARTRLQEWLNFISSELHKAFGPYFSGRPLDGAEKERADQNLARRIDEVERALGDGRSFVLGDTFTVADAYLFVILNWAGHIRLDLGNWPRTHVYLARVAARPAVRAAMLSEGLIEGEAAA